MPSILLVEDDELFRTILYDALKSAGHVVAPASNGHQAMALLQASVPDLVITDLVMPDQDGLGVIMTLQKSHPSLPIIAISGSVNNAGLYLAMAKKLGARYTLTKPFELRQLLEAVDAIFD